MVVVLMRMNFNEVNLKSLKMNKNMQNTETVRTVIYAQHVYFLIVFLGTTC